MALRAWMEALHATGSMRLPQSTPRSGAFISWCESDAACAQRAYAINACWIGSSRPECLAGQAPGNGYSNITFQNTMDLHDLPSMLGSRWSGGLLNNDPLVNPLTYDWNRVEIPYCDGGSYTGNNMNITFVEYNGETVPVYYRGFRNIQAIFDDLEIRYGFTEGKVSDAIVSGDSAGGLASYYHSDYIAGRVPSAAVVAAPDSGFFFTDPLYPSWTAGLHWVVSAMNSTEGLNQNCVSALQAAKQDPLTCAYPEVVAPYIKVPVFVMNSQYDPALDSISGGENGSNVTNVNRIAARLVSLVNATVLLNKPGNAAFITSCHEHCGQWAQGQTGQFGDFNVTIDSWQAVPAVAEWWAVTTGKKALADSPALLRVQNIASEKGFGAGRNVWYQNSTYPCSTCCSGGQV